MIYHRMYISSFVLYFMIFLYVFFVCMQSPVGEEFIAKLNQYRTEVDVNPVKENEILDKAAEFQADHEINTKECTHTGPPGNEYFATRFKNIGYENENIAENVAQNNAVNAEEVLNMWQNSPSHNDNMCNPIYNEAGIGYRKDRDGKVYWASTFGAGGNSENKPNENEDDNSDDAENEGEEESSDLEEDFHDTEKTPSNYQDNANKIKYNNKTMSLYNKDGNNGNNYYSYSSKNGNNSKDGNLLDNYDNNYTRYGNITNDENGKRNPYESRSQSSYFAHSYSHNARDNNYKNLENQIAMRFRNRNRKR